MRCESPNIPNCEIINEDDGEICDKCHPFYGLSDDGKQCKACDGMTEGCLDCGVDEDGKVYECYDCIGGTELIEGFCIFDACF